MALENGPRRQIRIISEKEHQGFSEPFVIGEVPEMATLPKIVHIDDISNPYSLRRRYRKFQKEQPHFIESLRHAKEDAVLFYDSNGTKVLRGVGVALAVVGVGVFAVVVYKHIEKSKR